MRHGSRLDPKNPFDAHHRELDTEHLEWDQEYLASYFDRDIQYFDDSSRSIISENDSPDIPFRYSLNPYRGCAHGCSYCYARNTHEYLGYNAGLDFETKIIVKKDAPALFRDYLCRDKYECEPIFFSGVTDCYQPIEREHHLTQACLEVALEAKQPIGIVTKNALVTRDIDLLKEMSQARLVKVFLSVTTLDPALGRDMEPRTSIPAARLRAIQTLRQANIPVGVMVAPVIPGLTDSEIPHILKAASDAGAQSAAYIVLRLPETVEPVFQEWLTRTRPQFADKVNGLIQHVRNGNMNSSQWHDRKTGTGQIALQIKHIFRIFTARYALNQELPKYNLTDFRPPTSNNGQMRLF